MRGVFVSASAFLPDDRLRELAQREDLTTVSALSFSVDTSENSLSDLGHRLPALKQLRLDGSNIATMRDLGTGLSGLRILWLARSNLRELEGFGSLTALSELYLAFNEVEDLSPLMGAERVQVLDLEGNAVDDPAQVHYLTGCDELSSLTLEGNPIAEAVDYRSKIVQVLPQLSVFDDEYTDQHRGMDCSERQHCRCSENGNRFSKRQVCCKGHDSVRVGQLADKAPGTIIGAVADAALRADHAAIGSIGQSELTYTTSTDAALLSCALMQGSVRRLSRISASRDAALQRELRFVRDAIKYTDTLRAYDVISHEALAMVRHPYTNLLSRAWHYLLVIVALHARLRATLTRSPS